MTGTVYLLHVDRPCPARHCTPESRLAVRSTTAPEYRHLLAANQEVPW